MARRGLEEDPAQGRLGVRRVSVPGACSCREPLTDTDLGLDGDDDMCWRCHKPIEDAE